jgi:hypothetical protein
MQLLELMLILAIIVGVSDRGLIQISDKTGRTQTVKLTCIEKVSTRRLKTTLPKGSRAIVRAVDKDEQNQIIGEVYVDNRSVNLQLVAEGNAAIDRASLNNCEENKTQFLIAEANAKNNKLGLWKQMKTYSLTGKLIYEEVHQTMSVRAYQGAEFFLITNNPQQEKLVLIPSATITRDRLQGLRDRQVEIKAVYLEGTIPSPQTVACPLDANGQCMRQGNGYQVLSIVTK